MNLPNALTLGRIFLVPLLVVVLLTKFEGRAGLRRAQGLLGAAIFGLASLTDWLDGYLARRRRQVTALGQLMDPLADKLLVTAALVSLVQLDLAPAWMVAVILGRELAVTVLRSMAHARGHGDAGLAARQDQDGRAGDGDPAADPRPATTSAVLRAGQIALWVAMLAPSVSASTTTAGSTTLLTGRPQATGPLSRRLDRGRCQPWQSYRLRAPAPRFVRVSAPGTRSASNSAISFS